MADGGDNHNLNIRLTAKLDDLESAMATGGKSLDAYADRTEEVEKRIKRSYKRKSDAAKEATQEIKKQSDADASTFAKSIDRIVAKTAEAQKQLNAFKGQYAGVAAKFASGETSTPGDLKDMLLNAGSLKNALALAGGPVGAAALLGGVAYGQMKQFAEIGDIADKARASAQSVQGFGAIMKSLGTDAASANGILSTFSDKLANARQFGGELKDTLSGLGIELSNSDGTTRSAIAVLGDFASRIKNTTDDSEKMRLAALAVGTDLAGPFLEAVNKSKTGLADLAAMSQQAGSSLTNDLAKGAQAGMAALTRLGERADGTYAQLKRLLNLANEADKIKAAQEDLRQTKDAGDALALAAKGGSRQVDDFGRPIAGVTQNELDRNSIEGLKGTFKVQGVDGTAERAAALQKALANTYGPKPAPDLPKTDDDDIGGGSRGGGRAASAKAEERDRAQEVLEALRTELSLNDQLAGGTETLAEKQRIIAELKRAGVDADSDQGREIAGLVTRIDAAKEKAKEYQAVMNQARTIAGDIASGIDSWAIQGRKFGDAMQSTLKQIESQLLRMVLMGSDGKGGIFGSVVNGLFGAGGGFSLSKLFGFAEGGQISGAGTGTSDSMIARVSNGEFIVRASQAEKNLPLLQAINSGKIPRFASGGMVGAIAAPSASTVSNIGGSITVAPVINTTVNSQGGAGDPAAQQALAQQTAAAIEKNVRAVIVSEMMKQMRPGNLLMNVR